MPSWSLRIPAQGGHPHWPGFADLETGLVLLTHPRRGYYYRPRWAAWLLFHLAQPAATDGRPGRGQRDLTSWPGLSWSPVAIYLRFTAY